MKSAARETNYEWLLLFACMLIQAVIYAVTFSRVPASDGFRYASDMDSRNWSFMLLPNHMGPQAVMIFFQKLMAFFLIHIPTLQWIRMCNVTLSILCFLLFYQIVRSLNISRFLSLASALTFVYSYGLWRFANGEIHHWGIAATLAICYLLRRFQEKPSRGLVISIAILHVAAMTFHEDHILMGAPIVWILLTHPSIRTTKAYLILYLVACAILTVFTFGAVAYFAFGVRSVSSFFHWLFVYHSQAKGYILLQKQDWPWIRLSKGSLMSFYYGAQILVDWYRGLIIHLTPATYVYLWLSAALLTIVTPVLLLLMPFLKRMSPEIRSFVGCLAVWIAAYKLLLNIRFAPESAEYHLSTLAPILLLIPISLSLLRKQFFAQLLACALFLTIFSVNLFAGILPELKYGKMIDQFEDFSNSYFKSDDFFVSSESGLDFVIQSHWEHLAIKDLFLSAPKEEAFQGVRKKIEDALSSGKRVFVYHLIPGGYGLRSIWHYNPRGNYSLQDFENFEQNLFEKYGAKEVRRYWESDSSQSYLFGDSSNVIWQLGGE